MSGVAEREHDRPAEVVLKGAPEKALLGASRSDDRDCEQRYPSSARCVRAMLAA
jgi:hypothetical protein